MSNKAIALHDRSGQSGMDPSYVSDRLTLGVASLSPSGGESFQDDEDTRFAYRLLHYAAEMRNKGLSGALIVSLRYGSYGDKKNEPIFTFIAQTDDGRSSIHDRSFKRLMAQAETWKISAKERNAKRAEQLRAELSQLEGGEA